MQGARGSGRACVARGSGICPGARYEQIVKVGRGRRERELRRVAERVEESEGERADRKRPEGAEALSFRVESKRMDAEASKLLPRECEIGHRNPEA